LAFSRKPAAGSWSLFLLELGTSAVKPLTAGGVANDQDPAWSPDGTQIAFDSTRPVGTTGTRLLWLASLDGNVQPLTKQQATTQIDLHPAWGIEKR
jgi:Tol biopolymer transport system component